MTLDLDDVPALAAVDPGGMLLAVASGVAQVREAAARTLEADVGRLADQARPRAVVVCGTGSSGLAGDVLACIAGPACPVPVVTHRAHGLPAWVGAADLVVAVSCSGRTQETLSALAEAVRRGCRLLVVGAAGSPLEELGARGRAVFVPVPPGRPPRASLWSLSVPLVVAADALGLLTAGPDALEEAAQLLQDVAVRCRPDAEVPGNPGKSLALELQGTLPVVWGASPLAGTAACRFAGQLHENAKTPATWGVLPEAVHQQLGALDGRWARSLPAEADFFRDREAESERTTLRLVLLRDVDEHPAVAGQARGVRELAAERGVGVSELVAEGSGALARLAALICVTDFASTYLALLTGVDPTPVPAVGALEQRIGP